METSQERKTELRKVIYENIITSRTRKKINELLRKKYDELKSNGLRTEIILTNSREMNFY